LGEEFVELIRILLKQMGMSVAEFESRVGVSPGMLSKWQKMVPGVDKLIAISNTLQVPVDVLLRRAEPSVYERRTEHSIATEMEDPTDSKTEDLLDSLRVHTREGKVKWSPLREAPFAEKAAASMGNCLPGEHCILSKPEEPQQQVAYIIGLAQDTGTLILYVLDFTSEFCRPILVNVKSKELQRGLERLAAIIDSALAGPFSQIRARQRIAETISGELQGVT